MKVAEHKASKEKKDLELGTCCSGGRSRQKDNKQGKVKNQTRRLKKSKDEPSQESMGPLTSDKSKNLPRQWSLVP